MEMTVRLGGSERGFPEGLRFPGGLTFRHGSIHFSASNPSFLRPLWTGHFLARPADFKVFQKSLLDTDMDFWGPIYPQTECPLPHRTSKPWVTPGALSFIGCFPSAILHPVVLGICIFARAEQSPFDDSLPSTERLPDWEGQ